MDNIVDDILSAEDDYITLPHQSNLAFNQYITDTNNDDYLMQVEFLKEINQLHSLDDELLYNDIDLDTFQNNQVFNSNIDIDYPTDRNEILFDFTECGKSMDQDIISALCQVKNDLPDEFLNVPDINFDRPELKAPESVNECEKIFESDVDLEASTNLAANLKQLIGENSVQYISSEDHDTFIISLNSEIDAAQLTDMLNIDVDKTEENKTELPIAQPVDNINVENKIEVLDELKQKEPIKVDEIVNIKEKEKKKVTFVCKTCKKTFNKKDNYKSHIGEYFLNYILNFYKSSL